MLTKVVRSIHDRNKIILSQQVGTVDLSHMGVKGTTNLVISHNLLTPMVEFPDGTVIALDIDQFVLECLEKYKGLKE